MNNFALQPPSGSARLPLIKLRDIAKRYSQGDAVVHALSHVSIEIQAGEFVAIVGASGSGKSTLMNIIGCLDKPTSGHYQFAGEDVLMLDGDALAHLRSEQIGFIFQGYNLIGLNTALENVALPALYLATEQAVRNARALQLLAEFGLSERANHLPTELSGGQQQRIAIARALMNGGRLILADEPTGALDSRTGSEVIDRLEALAQAGHTVVLITHDMAIASRARRVIELRDGLILSDSGTAEVGPPLAFTMSRREVGGRQLGERLRMGVSLAQRSLKNHLFRTQLTVLGIVIGIAALILLSAIGNGTKEEALRDIGELGASQIDIVPGKEMQFGEEGMASPAEFSRETLRQVAGIPQIVAVAPANRFFGKVTRQNQTADAEMIGTDNSFIEVADLKMQEGRFISDFDVAKSTPVVVVSERARMLFWNGKPPIGSYLWIGEQPFLVVGVAAEATKAQGDAGSPPKLFMPHTALATRLTGKPVYSFEKLTVLAPNFSAVEQTLIALRKVMNRERPQGDFTLSEMAGLIKASADIQESFNSLLESVAAISLLVGGIGMMNIQLISIVERTKEIGIRMAIGARGVDIQMQFLMETIITSLLGGVIGVALGLGGAYIARIYEVAVVFSLPPVLQGLGCALLVGVVFGWLPARRAARLDPVVALSH